MASLWELQGWTTEVTEGSGDDGRDIIAELNLPYEVTIKVEAKRWSEDNKVASSDIRQYALLPDDNIDHAVVVTSSSFTEPAKRTAARHDVKLVDSSRLIRLIQTLDAEALLTDDYSVSDWERVTSAKHLDWVVDNLGEEELVDVIPGIGQTRAKQLGKLGVHTLGDLLTADLETLAEETMFAESRLQRWINLAAFYKNGERLDVIDGIDQSAVSQLAEAEIYTVDDLQAACPSEIASQTDLHEETLKMWVGDAVRRDIARVTELPKIGTERARELAKAGILTVNDLAKAEPETVANQTAIGEQFLEERVKAARTIASTASLS